MMLRGLLSFFQRKPAADVTLVHPQLGLMKYEEGIWYGHAPANPKIEITIAGTELGPDEKQTERLLEHLENYSTLEKQIYDFLEKLLNDDPVIKPSDFHVESLDFLFRKHDGHFMVYMKMDGDEHSLWRIDFVDDQPKYLGRDS
jgi:hypothetical protein